MANRAIKLYCQHAGREFKEALWSRYDPRVLADFCVVYPTTTQERRERWARAHQFGVVQGNAITSKAKLQRRILSQGPSLVIGEEELAAFLSILLQKGEAAPELRESLVQLLGPRWHPTDTQRIPLGVLRRIVDEVRSFYEQDATSAQFPPKERRSALQVVTAQLRTLLDEGGVQYRAFALLDYWSNAPAREIETLFPGVQHIVLDGFLSFDAADYAMIDFFRRLSNSADRNLQPTVHVLVDFDPQSESESYPHFAELWARLRSQYAAQEIICCESRSSTDSHKRVVSPRIHSCRDREEEAKTIARLVREQIQSGVRPDRIGICFAHPKLYTQHLRRAFRENALPYRIVSTAPLAESAIWTFVVTLANTVGSRGENGIPLWAIDALLKNPWFRYASGQRGQQFLHHYRWLRIRCPEAMTLEELCRAALSPQHFEGGGEDDEEYGGVVPKGQENSEVRWKEVQESVSEVLQWIDQFTGVYGVEHWADLLKSVLGRLLAIACGSARYLKVERLDDFRHATAALAQLLNVAYRVRDAFSALLPGLKLDFPSYVETLLLLAETTPVAEHIRLEQGVEVVTPLECLGARFDVLVWGGLVEGEFPQLPTLSWRDTTEAEGVADVLREISVQRYVFRAVVETADRVHLCHPQFCDGFEVLRSRFLDELPSSQPGETEEARGKDLPTLSTSVLQRWKELAAALFSKGDGGEADQSERGGVGGELMNLAWLAAVSEYCQRPSMTSFEGNLGEDPAFVSAITAFFRDKVFSASELSALFTCPLRYFFERVLGVKAPSPPLLEEAAQYGQLVHAILCKFMRAMQELNYQPLLRADRDEIETTLLRITVQELVALFPNYPIRRLALALRLFGSSGLVRLTQEPNLFAELVHDTLSIDTLRNFLAYTPETQGALAGFVNCEVARWQREEISAVALLEWQFGLPAGRSEAQSLDSRSPLTPPVDIGFPGRPLFLRGRIDRVDVLADGSCYLIDYKTKTTKIGRPQKLKAAVSNWLQLILYAAAVERAQPEGISKCSNVGYFYVTDKKSELSGLNTTKSSCLEEYQEKVVAVVSKAVSDLAQGQFLAYGAANKKCNPLVASCPYFQSVCRGRTDETLVAKVPKCPWMTEA